MRSFQLRESDAASFVDELRKIRDGLDSVRGPEDLRHLRKIERWGRLATALGYGTAWMGVNPLSWIGIGLGISCRWMILAHHVLHGGYDRVESPARYKSKNFARGWRRWRDWCDWMEPRAWQKEHNGLHHHRLGEVYDPDIPERNFSYLARILLPKPVKWLIFILIGMLWKGGYYGPNVLVQTAADRPSEPRTYHLLASYLWNPFDPLARRVWLRSWFPYLAVRFGLMPLPFLALGLSAWQFVVVNTLFAELLTNFHSFLVIVTNHAGDDLPRFEASARNESEQLLRQIVGSVNFRTGSDWNDFLHGWLNYQIEHHLWPDLTLRQYQLAQPRVQALCARYGVPYLQESVWKRFRKLGENAIGADRMWRTPQLTYP